MIVSLHPHRRFNPLTGEWVLVSPQRTNRPWQGHHEKPKEEKHPSYHHDCYLCPGNNRANGEKNPSYKKTFVFTNDFPALIKHTENIAQSESNIFNAETVNGECRVVCFSPKHNQTLADMTELEIEEVVETWSEQINELGNRFQWVQVFENKGEMMGCSNPHPHGQIWAGNFMPNEVEMEDQQQNKYFGMHKSVFLLDYLKEELRLKQRIVIENDSWVVLVPFWAVWPFETLLLPKTYKSRFEFSREDKEKLAQIIKMLLVTYDKLFNTSMPYSMGWHFAPFNGEKNDHWQLHAHYYPPLLRSATVKKFMVGYEMLAETQRDITPEQAAARLREAVQ